MANTGKTVIRVRNAHATNPQNVTFVTPITVWLRRRNSAPA
ncbi:hypothetical protein [Streptomyces regalis]|nr:hypothetical protein [Streptomyces regalis]